MIRIKHMFRCSVWVLTISIVSAVGCGGSGTGSPNNLEYAEAGAVAGIAVTAALIQAARGSAKPLVKADKCCAVCNHCTFPCGDMCLTIGNICLKPTGCACYDSQLPIEDRPPQSDIPCVSPPGETGGDAVVVPLGVSY
jgi:hypothetical protein